MMDWRSQGLSTRVGAKAWGGYFHTLRDDLQLFAEEHVKPKFGACAGFLADPFDGRHAGAAAACDRL